MPRFSLSLRHLTRATVVVAAALVAPAALRAQTPTAPKVFHACYVPSSGTTYRIKETDLKQECSKSTHVQFSWTDGNQAALTELFTVTSTLQIAEAGQKFFVQVCPANSRLIAGGHRVTAYTGFERPFVSRSTPDDSGTGWAVNIMPATGSSVSFEVWVRCAR